MRVTAYAHQTDAGRKRRRNEDAFVVKPPVFAVADGMGGPRAGEVASSLATAAVKTAEGEETGHDRVVALIQAANRSVYERSSEDAAVSGMGTTMTIAVVEESVTIGHVGDSRAYLLRHGALEQLTDDHSLVSELVRAGKLSPEEAENHPQRSVITRALGTDPNVDVDVFTVNAHGGDVFLLCSDGLTSMVDDDAILQAMEAHPGDLARAARELVKLANKAGGEDNITVIAFEVSDNDDASAVLEETRPIPAVSDDEDTLDETDAVPTIDVAAGQTAAAAPKRRRWPLVLLLLVALAVAAAVVWYFIR
jgi:serine/threonine protein phosphatase PrpC